MALFKLSFFALAMVLFCSAAKGNTCDDTMENGGMIFLRASVVSYADDQIFKVKLSAGDFIRINSLVPKCDLTVLIKHPRMKIKLRRFTSNFLVGFEPNYARFVILTSR